MLIGEPITLKTGYTDPASGETWTTVTLRAPITDDEIKAQEAAGRSPSATLLLACLVHQCVVQFGPRQGSPGIHVIRSLTRPDQQRLVVALHALEDQRDRASEPE